MMVTVTVDFGPSWSFEEPGWRDLCYGMEGDRIYFWSARHLVVLSDGRENAITEARTDEDISYVFAAPSGAWVLVCETSVRLWDGRTETDRLELGDVAVEAQWDSPRLVVRDQRGASVEIVLVAGKLVG